VSNRVLITGASGFIGRRLLPLLLAAGHEVHAISRRPPAEMPAGTTRWHRADLLSQHEAADLVAHLRPEFLVHLAWYTEHGRYWEARENTSWVEASLRLVSAFSAVGGARALCLGTCAEYAWREPLCVEGKTPLEPATLYGVAKDATRRVAEALAERSSFELAWARPFLLYGPGEDPRRLIPSVARALLARRPAEVGDATLVRDLMHVDDVASALAAVLLGRVCGAINIATGTPTQLSEAIEIVAEAAGAPELVRFGSRPRRIGEPDELVGSPARLRDEVGFVPGIDLAAGLTATVEWWRDRQS
jgi:nucleoside-diphosphate-sugar epimerase